MKPSYIGAAAQKPQKNITTNLQTCLPKKLHHQLNSISKPQNDNPA